MDGSFLENIDLDTGAAPKRRIATASDASGIWWNLWTLDQAASYDRMQVQAMLDGRAPYLPDEIPSDCCNVNFGDAYAALEQSLTAYLDLVNSVPVLFSVKTRHGNTSQRYQWEQIIAEEFTKMIKGWDQFEAFFQPLTRFFVSEGVALAYFPGDIDWRPTWTNLQYFKTRRGATTDPSTFEVFTINEAFPPHKLYNFIRNPKIAASRGWNVKAVREALVRYATPELNTQSDWERWERMVKDNDLYISYSTANVVHAVHVFNIEFDGSVSHYIILRDNQTESFLFEQNSRFKSVYNVLVPFFYGVGNGDFHSIRGLGFKIFALMQAMNRLKCSMMDSAQLSSTVFITPENEEAVNDIGILRINQGITVLPSGLKLNQQPVLNAGQNALPIIDRLSQNISQNTQQYQGRAIPTDSKERTRREVDVLAAEAAVLSTASTNLFYPAWNKLGNEMMRRVRNRKYRQDDPGAKEVFEFKRRLRERGVPMEALYQVEEVTAMRAIGQGSAANRVVVQGQIMQLSGAFDEVGKYNATRNMVASQVGWDQVDLYVPPMAEMGRKPIDTQFAVMEEAIMKDGTPIPVLPEQNDAAHLEVHMPTIQSVFMAYQQGAVAPDKAFGYFNVAIQHDSQHLQNLSLDPSRKEQVSAYSKVLNQVAQVAKQIGQQLQEQMAAQQQAAQGQSDVENQLKIQKAQLDNQIKMAKANLDMQIKREKALQQMAIKDAQSAQKITQKSQDQAQDLRQSAMDEALV